MAIGGRLVSNTGVIPAFRRVSLTLIVLGLTGHVAAAGQQQANNANNAPPGARTGLIVGQVIDAVSGGPISEAVVQISMPGSFNNPSAPRGRVITDDEGRYFFADLPAGKYYLSAQKAGFMGGVFGQRRPSGETQQLVLAEGERRPDVKLPLWKYGAIAGTVIDESGEPVVGVTVQALSRDFLAGHARYGKMVTQPWAVPTATTDDRGMFRLAALAPADYAIVVPSTQASVPVAVLESFPQNSSLRGDLLMAVRPNGGNDANSVYETFPLGQSRAQQIGDVALLTMNGVAIPPPHRTGSRLEVYPTTFYPAATTVGAAALITVKAGEERSDIGLRLRPASAVRVSGRLITPSGAPPGPTVVRLIGASAQDIADEGFETAVGMSDAGGRFALLAVPPGEYVLKTNDRFLNINVRQGLAGLWAQQPVSVGSTDVNDLVVTMRPPLTITGRLEYHSATGAPPGAREVTPRLVMFDRPAGDRGFAAEVVNGTFSIAGTAGQYIVHPAEVPAWSVESVMIDGKNVTDAVADLTTDTSVVVTYTDRHSPVSGMIKDGRGAASSGALALLFPTIPERWVNYGANPRTLKAAPADRTGAFAFADVPPGDYFVIAIDGADADNWTDPKTLALLARQATKLTVTAGEPKTLDLTLKVVR